MNDSLWNLKSNDTNELTYRTERDSRTYKNIVMVAVGEQCGGGVAWDAHVPTAAIF